MGRVELLLSAGRALGRPELVRRARSAALRIAARARGAGAYRLRWAAPHGHASLFQGTAGVAYQLLRTWDPETFPSLLVWS
jgi:lantibiotic modifying enzyme